MDDSLPAGKDREILYPEQLRDDIVERAKRLVQENPNVGAIVLECANLPPFAKAVQDAVNLPVYDFVTLTNFVYSAFVRKEFTEFI
jgi:Asp/Glu/hydantoin racemase